jgi:hypothetical protein
MYVVYYVHGVTFSIHKALICGTSSGQIVSWIRSEQTEDGIIGGVAPRSEELCLISIFD